MSTPSKHGVTRAHTPASRELKSIVRDEVKREEPLRRRKKQGGAPRLNVDRMLSDIEVQDRQASLAYLRARWNPDSAPAARIPDLMRFPSAVTKTRTIFNWKLVALPGSGSGAPNYGGLLFVHPGLRTKAQYGTDWTTLGGEHFSNRVMIVDPIYGESGGATGPITQDTWLAYRPTAMCVRLENTTALLNRDGSIKVALLSNNEDSVLGDPNVTTKNYNYLDGSPAMPMDNAEVNESQRHIWVPGQLSDDMTYQLVGYDNYGPYLAFQADSNTVAQSFKVIVDTHYEYLPSRSYRQLVETRAAEGTMEQVDDLEALAATVATDDVKVEGGVPDDVDDFPSVMGSAVDTLVDAVGEYVPKPFQPLAHGLKNLIMGDDPADAMVRRLRANVAKAGADSDSDAESTYSVVQPTGQPRRTRR